MKVKLRENGPMMLDSNGQAKLIKNGQETPIPGSVVAVCRCGQSKKTPFCDGSHNKVSFKADAAEIEL
jgi:CDGSH iron-sulfur domain-containing protein 3